MSAPKPFPSRPKAAGNGSGFGKVPMPIALENKTTGEIHTFQSGQEASVATQLTPAAVSQLRNRRRWQAHCPATGTTWRLPGVESPSGSHGHRPKPPGGRQPKPISLRCIETGQVYSFSSHKEACDKLMLEDTGLTRLSKGIQRTYRGLRLA